MRTSRSDFTNRGRRRRLAAAALAVLLAATLLACSSCGSPSFSNAARQRLDGVLQDTISRYDLPGGEAGVWVPGKGSWVEAKGKGDIAGGRPLETGDRFRIGSSTKTFVATVILQLCDERRLALDDAAGKYTSGLPGLDGITVRQLLNMTSGLFNYTDDERFLSEVRADPLREWKPEQLIAVAAGHKPYFPPGKGWAYSNTNYILLGRIIEKVTGRGAGEEITKRTVDRLGLADTSFPAGPDIQGKHAHGYWDDNRDGKLEDITGQNPSHAWTAGAMISNMADLKVWVEAVASGKLVSKAAHAEQMKWVDTGSPEFSYGLGVFKIAGFIGHGGAIFGYNSSMFAKEGGGGTIVVMVNEHPVGEEGKAVAITDIFRGMAIAMPGAI